jgi:hypothetical protein
LIKGGDKAQIMRKKFHQLKICAFAAPFKKHKIGPQTTIQHLLQENASDAFRIFLNGDE